MLLKYSTVGYQEVFNPGLQIEDEQAFIDYILSNQPEAPTYFAVMKRVNKEGPRILGRRPLPEKLNATRVATTAAAQMLIDTGSPDVFAEGHVKGSINIKNSRNAPAAARKARRAKIRYAT